MTTRARGSVGQDPEVRHRRAAPAVDCLIVIANGATFRVPRAEQLHDLELGPVRVLELVDEDVLVLPLEPAEHVRSRAQSLRAWTIWSPKSMAPLAPISSWYFA